MSGKNNKLIVYTDGSAIGNPGPGGYGVVLSWGKIRKELSAGFKHTTNNRMELLAVIEALSCLTREGLEIAVYTDSKYVKDAVTNKWVWKWRDKGWKNKKNVDLWKRFLELFARHRVEFHWVKGHDGNVLNERCDFLATQAAKNGPWQTDEGYINMGV
jgi:ribonuclease HI